MGIRIGIMLRSMDEKGGIGVYTRHITDELLKLGRDHRYFLFYRNPANLGRFAHYANSRERVVRAPDKATWDQIAIPLACRQERIDVLFHPKFTVPLLAPCKTVMVLHGAGWFMPEFQHFWGRSDVRYIKALMPVYCRKASAVISVSRLCTSSFNSRFNLPPGRISTVYFAPGRHFKPVRDQGALAEVRARYRLPDRFIFTLSGYDRGDRKNFAGIFKAFRIQHGKTDHKLVVGGKDCHKFRQDYAIPDESYGRDIFFTGWIDQKDLPAIYSLADLFLYPSNVEAFPIPVTEALASGTPIVTSRANGLLEIVGDAALLVDPNDAREIADSVFRVLTDRRLHGELSARGLERARMFTWDKCARTTLDILTGTVSRMQ